MNIRLALQLADDIENARVQLEDGFTRDVVQGRDANLSFRNFVRRITECQRKIQMLFDGMDKEEKYSHHNQDLEQLRLAFNAILDTNYTPKYGKTITANFKKIWTNVTIQKNKLRLRIEKSVKV